MNDNGKMTLGAAALVVLFAGFVFYLVLLRSADPVPALLAVWAVIGPLLTAIVQAYFHSQANEQGATISATGAAAGAAAASGQSTSVETPTGKSTVIVGNGQPTGPTLNQ